MQREGGRHGGRAAVGNMSAGPNIGILLREPFSGLWLRKRGRRKRKKGRNIVILPPQPTLIGSWPAAAVEHDELDCCLGFVRLAMADDVNAAGVGRLMSRRRKRK
jgi:hypothetical protein